MRDIEETGRKPHKVGWEAGTQLCHKSYPQHRDPQLEEAQNPELISRSKGSRLYLGPAPERKATKISNFANQKGSQEGGHLGDSS